METKKDLIKATVMQLLKIARKHSHVEALPVPVTAEMSISTSEAHTIQAIGEHDQINITDLAGLFGYSKSAASQIVAKLSGKGFIEKNLAPNSNKEYQLSLTYLGWQAFKAHEQFHGHDMNHLVDKLEPFSISQIATISVLLESIDEVFEERLKSAK